jgi:hypothetical protein
MLLQEFLRANPDGIQLLKEKYGVGAKRHKDHPELVLFKYSQIDSPMGDPMVQECRGVILDESNDWAVVARPFDKFFNHGEGHAKPIDWSTARVQEKLDGSLMQLYWHGEWHVASSGTPDAAGQVNGFGFSFADLFWKTFNQMGYKLPDQIDDVMNHVEAQWHAREYVYLFELMTPYNRVVVQHLEPRLVLIGQRHKDGTENYPEYWDSVYQTVQSFPLTSIESIIASFQHISPLSQEGYVVVDGAFNRVKVKSPAYVALHHMKDSMSPRRALEVVRAGEISEVLNAFPEWKDIFTVTSGGYEALVAELEQTYEGIKGIVGQKDFALQATKTRCSGALFSLRAGKVPTIRQYLASMQIDSLASLLKIETAAAFNFAGNLE